MSEKEVFELLIKAIEIIRKNKRKPIRIAVNGIEGTGKTFFATRLTDCLKKVGLNTIHISIDGFHFNKKNRYKQGRNSAKGYYENSYDELGFVNKVLIPSQSDNPNYILATHDLITDEYLILKPTKISNDTTMITDGAYLFKPNYRNH